MSTNGHSSGRSKKVTLALIGCGRVGYMHLKSIVRHARIRLKWIVEEVAELATKALDDVGLEDVSVVNFEKVAEVFQDPSVQGVIVCTPTATHQHIVIQALRAGKAVFCEKPVAHNYQAADECYKVAEEMKLPLLCGFNRRFDPTWAPIIKQSRSGQVGQIKYIKTTQRDTADPNFKGLAMLGGCFLDMGIHDVDTICACLGELPVTVSVEGSTFIQIKSSNAFDQAIANLKFPSGALATIELSRFCNYGYDVRMEVFGMKGMLSAENIHQNDITFSGDDGMMKSRLLNVFTERHEESYQHEMDHFVKVLEGKEEVCISREAAVAAIKIVEACEKAAKTKKIIDLQW